MARLPGEECGRTNSDVNADKNPRMKQLALAVKVGRTKKSIFDSYWSSKRIVLKLFGVYACMMSCCFCFSFLSTPTSLTQFTQRNADFFRCEKVVTVTPHRPRWRPRSPLTDRCASAVLGAQAGAGGSGFRLCAELRTWGFRPIDPALRSSEGLGG